MGLKDNLIRVNYDKTMGELKSQKIRLSNIRPSFSYIKHIDAGSKVEHWDRFQSQIKTSESFRLHLTLTVMQICKYFANLPMLYFNEKHMSAIESNNIRSLQRSI